MKPNRKLVTTNTDERKPIYQLILISFVIKFVLVLATVFIFKSFIDTFAITYYFERVITLFQGQIPYISYTFEYPPLVFIPAVLALIPAILTNSQMIYVLAFAFLMFICDTITMMCIYRISLKLWGNNRQAFIAAFLYVTAISVAYVTITEFAAFATMLMMIGITVTIDRKEKFSGYLSAMLGFFTKIFPIISLPFLVLYNSKETSLKTELLSSIKWFSITSLILFAPLYFINPANLDTYIFRINGGDRGMYASAVTYTVYSWLHDVLHIPITTDLLFTAGKIVMVAGIITLLYVGYKVKKKDPILLLKLILCALFIVISCMQFNSPNYWTWYIPIMCILVAADIKKMALFIMTQIIAYIVFPLSFWSLWTNPGYVGAVGTPGWQLALGLFTMQFVVMLVLVYLVVNPKEIMETLRA